MSLKPNPFVKLKIVFENNDIIVIDKPAGLLVHPIKDENDTLANGLLAYYPAIKNVGDPSPSIGSGHKKIGSPENLKPGENLRPGIVHRLDRDTSGLMVAAKNNAAFQCLKKQFQQREVKKIYLALVHGKVKDKKGTITKVISASKNDYRRKTTLLDDKAKKAITKYRVIKYCKNFTLLEIFPETGRSHQIRVHLASIGHPVAGDQQYKFKRQIPPENLKRQFLHAWSLKFRLPNGKMVKFKSELPNDLKKVIDEL